MSFLSSLNEMELGETFSFNLELPNVFKSIFSIIRRIYDSFNAIFKKLSIIRKTLIVREVWAYQIDEETGIRILNVEKDSLALDKTRNELRDLFV